MVEPTQTAETVRIKPAPYGGKNLNLLPPDDILRELLLEAKREFDWWSSLTDKEYDEIVARFGGEMSTRDYIDAKLLYHLNGILSIMSRTSFMREYQDRLKATHTHVMNNRQLLSSGGACGCFYCLRTFDASAVTLWVDDGQTALCPHCHIDAVLSSKVAPIDADFLGRMHAFWFDRTTKINLTDKP